MQKMSEKEAIKNMTAYVYMECENIPQQVIKALNVAREALEEIQQYRATGLTPQMVKDLIKSEKQAHKIALENATLLDEYREIGTVEELQKMSRLVGGDENVSDIVNRILKEYAEYQSIGTVEELKNMKENGAFTGVELAQIAAAQMKLKEYRRLEEQGLLLRLPAAVGDTVYVICQCGAIPKVLDGTLYEPDGSPGTATGYYCPYEDGCPHECMDCDDLFDCDKYQFEHAIFEDEVQTILINENGVEVATLNCPVCSEIGRFVFLAKEEAEAALQKMKGGE